MNSRSLELLEYPRVIAELAGLAECAGARERLLNWEPFADSRARAAETALLAEAIARQAEPGAWLAVGRGELEPHLAPEIVMLEGVSLLEVRSWIEAASRTRAAWAPEEVARRHPRLHAMAVELPALDGLGARLAASLDPDGAVRDAASPTLAHARAAFGSGERELSLKLERWAKSFGESTYVTRHGDRFVALVPAAGFPRRRAMVHDVSGSGQSLFVEPIEMCEANNRLIELCATVAEEERRILRTLTEAVHEERERLLALETGLVHLDTFRARARWARERGATAIAPGGPALRLASARHPLLLGQPQTRAVPLDLELGPKGTLLLVSGPNMGGKTVLLKTVGLAVAMAHAALPVLAREGSAIPEIETIAVDLGDAQSLDQGLSTFAAHLKALDTMARVAGPRTLLLCDELGAGTDPEEGAPLGRALVEHFAARSAWAVITTHLGALKLLAGAVPGVVNGSLEIDPATMAPTYRFISGVPGASHALAMAERLGLDPELVARARATVRAESATLERVLQDLQALRLALDAETMQLARAKAEAEEAARAHREGLEAARLDLDQVTRRLTRESDALLARARELWQTVQREARRSDKTREGAAALKSGIAALESESEGVRRSGEAAYATLGIETSPKAAPREVGPGTRVRVPELGLEAEIAEGPDRAGNVKLKRGGWSIQSHVSKLEPVGGPETAGRPASTPGNTPGARRGSGTRSQERAPGATWEAGEAPLDVDLRGAEVDEALRALDQALDRAVVSGLTELRVIHGMGKGVLRAAVERHLKGHAQVRQSRLGQVGEGGRGVTVVTLR